MPDKQSTGLILENGNSASALIVHQLGNSKRSTATCLHCILIICDEQVVSFHQL